MANASYCRFENTLADLEDCYNALCDLENGDLEPSEEDAMKQLLKLCSKIDEEFGDKFIRRK